MAFFGHPFKLFNFGFNDTHYDAGVPVVWCWFEQIVKLSQFKIFNFEFDCTRL